jgi:hypothetical protein
VANFTEKEVPEAIMQMEKIKAPGLNVWVPLTTAAAATRRPNRAFQS